ncbi:MAG TPA: hypothetical protein VNI84_00010 [Pyrinomonadaceae bacterium]|nr:hypothetical protein [Pyrinomonadaceae bacterium]
MRDKNYADNFKKLLNWLDSDGEKAAREYERIRRILITIFLSNGCSRAEDLTDITFDRVALKIDVIKETYQGNKRLYFAGVARKVILEARREKELLLGEGKFEIEDDKSSKFYESEEESLPAELGCLRKCLKELKTKRRKLILAYFDDSNAKKIEHHKKIAENFSMSANALRLCIFKDKKILLECCRKCIGSGEK